MELRDYQAKAVMDIRNGFKKSKRVCFQLPTGGGKTAVAGAIIKRMHDLGNLKGGGALFVVHRKELLFQTLTTLRELGYGGMVGVVAAGHAPSPWQPLQVGSIQTMAARVGKLPWLKPKLIIVDEAHHIRAKSWEKVLDGFGGNFVLGLTATPARLDGKGLGTFFGELVTGPSTRELMDAGWLAEADCYSIATGVDLKGMKRRGGDYAADEQAARMGSAVVAKTLDAWERIAGNERTIVYSPTVQSSIEFCEQMRNRGHAAEHIDGTTLPVARQAAVARFRSGRTKILGNVEIVTEGFDVPECGCVLIRRKTLSQTLWLQMVGRALRPKSNGRPGIVIDGVGNYYELGAPDDHIEWTLTDGVGGDGDKKKPTPPKCPECERVYRIGTRVCPHCGYEKPVKLVQEVDVGIVNVQKAKVKGKPRPKPKITNKELMGRVYRTMGNDEKMAELAAELGYNPYITRHWHKLFERSWGRAA